MNTLPAKLLLSVMLLLCLNLNAQQPILKIGSKDSLYVSLTKLKTEVKVIGNYAITTMEMEFCNRAPRVLEGELVFPMPEGVSVSRYAIDINGKMREAVPVEKEKGQVVFENIERRRVDPGLLEKVAGNNFRTRIYPIPANGCRKVIIGYEQLLGVKDNSSFLYSLPLHFKRPLKEFDFSITVASNYIPEVGSDCNTHLKFEELNKVFTSSVSEKNYTPNGSFNIIIPKTADAAEVSMQEVKGQYYFLINTFPTIKKIEKKIPDVITVIWDASLSGMKRDHKKELDLLDSYIKTKGQLTIHLYQVALDFKKIDTYTISGGNWNEMRKTLENITYDGATDFSTIRYFPPGKEYLVFTDGLNTFGNIDNMTLPIIPVYTICAAPTADYSLLKYVAAKTGGAFINLNDLDIAAAQKYLTEQTLQFLGIKSNSNISDVYPSVATPVGNNCTIAGISNSANQTIKLQFGYGSTVAFEQSVDMNFILQKTNFINIEKIWAQKKISELDIQYEKNKDELTAIGKKYSIITRGTSLIVLDSITDYVRYEIEPPAELMGEYTRLTNEKRSNAVANEKDAQTEAETYFNSVQSWWNTDFNPSRAEGDGVKKSLRPSDNIDTGLMERSLNTYTEVTTVDSGRYVIHTDSVVFNQGVGAWAGSSSPLMVPVYDSLGNTSMSYSVSSSSTTFSNPVVADNIGNVVQYEYRSVEHDGVAGLENKTGGIYARDNISDTALMSIVMKDVSVEKPYLEELKKVNKEDRYKKYLEIRKTNNLPTFYSDIATQFFKDGDTATGYKILSNIAELNLDDHELYKMLGYRLKTIGRFDDEMMAFKKVMKLRPQDPQSYRDYALALADAGKYQQALDTLYLALTKDYDQQLKNLYPGIEEIIVTEINELIAQHGEVLNISKINKSLIKEMPVDVRVVLNWNMNATDIDLWVIDPNYEKCFYSHTLTAIGGRISRDFTQGYGPEQFMLKKAMKGKYTVKLNYYGDSQQKIAGPTTVMAEIFTNYGSRFEQRKMITLQMEKGENGEVLVGEFSF